MHHWLTEREKKSEWRSKSNRDRKKESRVMERERKRERNMSDSVKLVLLHDFLADVKDWMFHNLLQLNLDKTGIIQGEEKLE